jgi:hypothetical protein
MITGTVVNVYEKINFTSFSLLPIFLKGTNLIIYKFYNLKFTFSHVWDWGSEIRKKIIPDPDPWGKKAPDPGSGSATLCALVPGTKIPINSMLKNVLSGKTYNIGTGTTGNSGTVQFQLKTTQLNSFASKVRVRSTLVFFYRKLVPVPEVSSDGQANKLRDFEFFKSNRFMTCE